MHACTNWGARRNVSTHIFLLQSWHWSCWLTIWTFWVHPERIPSARRHICHSLNRTGIDGELRWIHIAYILYFSYYCHLHKAEYMFFFSFGCVRESMWSVLRIYTPVCADACALCTLVEFRWGQWVFCCVLLWLVFSKQLFHWAWTWAGSQQISETLLSLPSSVLGSWLTVKVKFRCPNSCFHMCTASTLTH